MKHIIPLITLLISNSIQSQYLPDYEFVDIYFEQLDKYCEKTEAFGRDLRISLAKKHDVGTSKIIFFGSTSSDNTTCYFNYSVIGDKKYQCNASAIGITDFGQYRVAGKCKNA